MHILSPPFTNTYLEKHAHRNVYMYKGTQFHSKLKFGQRQTNSITIKKTIYIYKWI